MKGKNVHSVQRKTASHMGDGAFADLSEALKDARAFERGERCNLHVTRIRASRPTKDVSPKDRQTSEHDSMA